jgi:hypothetical protein
MKSLYDLSAVNFTTVVSRNAQFFVINDSECHAYVGNDIVLIPGYLRTTSKLKLGLGGLSCCVVLLSQWLCPFFGS